MRKKIAGLMTGILFDNDSQSCRGGTGSSAQARSQSRQAQRRARTACSWCGSRPWRRHCTSTWRVIAYSVSVPTLKPKKNTVVLATSLRSALRIRCWCCTTALCLCKFALVQAALHSHALSGQRHKVAPSWSLSSDFRFLSFSLSLVWKTHVNRTKRMVCTRLTT